MRAASEGYSEGESACRKGNQSRSSAPFPGPIARLNAATVLQRNLLDYCEAQSGAFRFRGVERQKNLWQVGLRNSRSVVGDADSLPFPPAEFFDAARNRHQRSFAVISGRFGGVSGQVDQSLADKRFIAGKFSERAFQM